MPTVKRGNGMYSIVEVRSHTIKFRTSVATEQQARNTVFHLRKAEPGIRFAARRPDGTYLINPR